MPNKLTYEYVEREFKKKGYTLLSTNYTNAHTKLDYICKEGHKHSMIWSNFKKGASCPTCAIETRTKQLKLDTNIVIEAFKKEGYILHTKEYINARTYLKYTCPRGHRGKTTWNNWNSKDKCRCPYCSNKISKQEKEIQRFLEENDVDFVANTRNVLINPATKMPLELDLWFPELNKAIEFNGEYWHSRPARIKCDNIKSKLCKEKGIDLMIIMYKDWIHDSNECKQQIINFLK